MPYNRREFLQAVGAGAVVATLPLVSHARASKPPTTLAPKNPFGWRKAIYVHQWDTIPPGIRGVTHFTGDLAEAIELAGPDDLIVVWEGEYDVGQILVPKGKDGLTILGSPDALLHIEGIETESAVTFKGLRLNVIPEYQGKGWCDARYNHPETNLYICYITCSQDPVIGDYHVRESRRDGNTIIFSSEKMP